MEVEMTIRGLMMDPVSNMPIVILKDVGGETVLPIWVGVYEANAIAEIMGVAVTAIHMRLSRARQRVAERLTEHDINPGTVSGTRTES